MSFSYYIYGLRLTSSRRINLLSEQFFDQTDLSVEWIDREEQAAAGDNLEWERVLTKDLEKRNGIALWQAAESEGVFKKICFATEHSSLDFLLSPDGKNLRIIYDCRESETDLDSYFVGPVLGCILRLLGTICLHASVVEIDKRAIVILGKKRSGKSTTAAGFSRLGYKVLADDLAAITLSGKTFVVHPAYSKIRVRAKSAQALYSESRLKLLPIVYSHRDSRYLSLETEGGFSNESLPLGAMYLLGETNEPGAAPFVEPIAAAEKIVRLNENTFGNYVVTKDLRKKEFLFLSDLANRIPFRRLVFGHDLDTLFRQCRAVAEDFRRLKN